MAPGEQLDALFDLTVQNFQEMQAPSKSQAMVQTNFPVKKTESSPSWCRYELVAVGSSSSFRRERLYNLLSCTEEMLELGVEKGALM